MPEKPFVDCYWVVPDRFLAGHYPIAPDETRARTKLQGLLRAGIETFIDLTEPGERGLKPYDVLLQEEVRKFGRSARHVRMPIPDATTGSAAGIGRVLALIGECLSTARPLYLHCFGGHGRTGMVVGCYLVGTGLSGPEALEKVALLHRETSQPDYPSPETAAQRRMVLDWKGAR